MIAEGWGSGDDGHKGQEGKITKGQKGAFRCDGTYVHYLAGRDGFTDFLRMSKLTTLPSHYIDIIWSIVLKALF